MKKTLITLMALAGMAAAETITITPLTSTESWTLDPNSSATEHCLTLNNGVLSGRPNWTVGTATHSLDSAFVCKEESDTLSFSFVTTNNGTGNSCLTLALIGSENAIVVGHGTYDKPGDVVGIAVTDNLTANGYIMATTEGNTGAANLTAGANLAGAMPTNGATSTISGNIAWDGDSYALTLSSSAVTDTVTYDLGLTSIDVTSLMITLEGGPNGNNEGWAQTPTMSNLTITGVIPEPTTATLSLLALAGLAARRRRK